MSFPAGRPVCIPAGGIFPFVTVSPSSACGTRVSVLASDAVAAVAAIAAVANGAAVVADGIAVGVAGCRCGGTDMTRGRGTFVVRLTTSRTGYPSVNWVCIVLADPEVCPTVLTVGLEVAAVSITDCSFRVAGENLTCTAFPVGAAASIAGDVVLGKVRNILAAYGTDIRHFQLPTALTVPRLRYGCAERFPLTPESSGTFAIHGLQIYGAAGAPIVLAVRVWDIKIKF